VKQLRTGKQPEPFSPQPLAAPGTVMRNFGDHGIRLFRSTGESEMRSILVIAAAACVFAASGAALAAQMDPHTNVSSFTPTNIMSAAQAVNFQAEVLTDNTGNKAVGITASNGMKFIAQPVTCKQPNQGECIALSIFGVFGGWNPTLQAVNYFNGYRSFTKVFLDENQAMLTRYEISDFGIPFGNIAANLTNFAEIADQFRQFLDSGSTGVSYTPTPDSHIVGSAFGGTPVKLGIDEPKFTLTREQKSYINTIKR
jgi:hypothetical protein